MGEARARGTYAERKAAPKGYLKRLRASQRREIQAALAKAQSAGSKSRKAKKEAI